jgi:ABC-type multidrug transport system ATPase subunit
MSDMNHAIETRELVKCYGARRALDGLTLDVPRFSMLGLIGPNGAGKTTWMMSVAGFLHLSSGTVNLLGGGPFDAAVHRGRIAILPQDSELPLESRSLELLTHYGLLQGLTRPEAVKSATAMLNEVHLGDRFNAPIRSLSHGMRKRVMIAQCFIGYPEVVLLDEPLSGLDPRETAHMRDFLNRRRGRQTVVISSHNLHDIELVCDRVAFVEKGRTVRVASLDEVTGTSCTLVYGLASEPDDLAALGAAMPEATLALAADGLTLTCRYDPRQTSTAEINRLLLPALLGQACGVLTVSQGASLEAEYLKNV